MKNTPKIAVALLAAGFVGATLAPAAAQSTPAMKGKPAAEKRMAYSAGHHGKRGHRANRAMKRAFDRYDVNKDGVITQEEVEAVIAERFNSYAGENGVITLDDFRAAWIENSRLPMVRAFQRLTAMATARSRSRSSTLLPTAGSTGSTGTAAAS